MFLDERQVPLLRLAIVLCGSQSAAEDVLQDVLMRAYTQWPRITALESPFGYVRKMLVNEHLSWRRRTSRQFLQAEADPEALPDHAERIVARDDLLRQVHALPERQRTAVILRYFEDLDDAEIARLMDCEPVTVRSYVSRGLAGLRTEPAKVSTRPGRLTGKESSR